MAGLGEQPTPKKTVTPGHPATGYVVLDLETRESFQAVGGFNPSLLTISVAGTYDAPTGTERTLRLEELETLEHLLRGASAIIGYNLTFNAEQLRSYVGAILAKKHKQTVALFRISRNHVHFSFRTAGKTTPSSLTLSEILGGSGHRNAAGARIPLKKFLRMIIT